MQVAIHPSRIDVIFTTIDCVNSPSLSGQSLLPVIAFCFCCILLPFASFADIRKQLGLVFRYENLVCSGKEWTQVLQLGLRGQTANKQQLIDAICRPRCTQHDCKIWWWRRRYIGKDIWWRGIVVRPPVLSVCFPYLCARLTAGHVTTLWVKLSVSQEGQLSLPSLRGRLNE